MGTDNDAPSENHDAASGGGCSAVFFAGTQDSRHDPPAWACGLLPLCGCIDVSHTFVTSMGLAVALPSQNWDTRSSASVISSKSLEEPAARFHHRGALASVACTVHSHAESSR